MIHLRRLRKPNDEGALRTRAAPFRLRLIVMAKLPVAGRVKTRLAGDIGTVAATGFARSATATLLQRVSPAAVWETIVAVSPDTGVAARMWPCATACMPQGAGDLGARMQRIVHRVAPGPVVIIGTDAPGVRRAHIRHAFRLLGRHDVVFGPARAGGYWLVGLKRFPRTPRLFAGAYAGPVRMPLPTRFAMRGACLSPGWRSFPTSTQAQILCAAIIWPAGLSSFAAKSWRDKVEIVM